MKKYRFLILALCIVVITVINVFAAVYFTPSSSSIYNSDGISQSKSVISSPIGGNIVFKTYGGLEKSNEMFSGAIFDGEKVWLVPFNYNSLASVTPSGEIKTLDLKYKGEKKYWGGTFDGQDVYFAPYEAQYIIKLDVQTGEITEINDYNKGDSKYKGAVFDGEYIWFIPSDGRKVLCMDSLGEIQEYDIPFDIPDKNAFSGGVLANEKIYFIPDEYRGSLIVLNRNTGEFSKLDTSLDTSYSGAIFDGERIYFIPKNKGDILSVSYETGQSEKNQMGDMIPDDVAFSGGAFDGRYIWLSPIKGGIVLSYDIFDKEYMLYRTEDGDNSYISGCFDSKNVWFAPYSADSPLRISGDNTPPTALNLFLTTTTQEPVTSEFAATDEDEGDTITFQIVRNGRLGSVIADSSTGEFTYTPNGTAGYDVFYYNVSDGKNYSNTAAVTVNILENSSIKTGRYIDLWGHWAEEAANFLTDNSVLLGECVDDFYYFYPDYTMNRAQFAVWANSAFGYQGSMSDDTLPFEDTDHAPEWVKMAASGAYHAKMMSGSYDSGRIWFKPYESLTRAEAITILYNILKPETENIDLLDFADRDIFPDWSEDAIKGLKSIGMLKGYDDNTVRPYNTITRAEAAKLLYDALLYIEGNNGALKRLK